MLTNFGRRHNEEHFYEIILNLDQWFRRRGHLKIFLIYSSGGLLFSASNHLFNYETIMNWEQWFKRKCCLKTFLISSGTICSILEESIMRNSSVKSI